MDYTYHVQLQTEPDGRFTVVVPSLPGCITHGESVAEAQAMAKEAIELYLQEQKARGEQIVDDSDRLLLMIRVEG